MRNIKLADAKRPDLSLKRVFIDCTPTWLHGGRTGIQRVIRNVVASAREAGARELVECTPVVHDGQRFYQVAAPLRNMSATDQKVDTSKAFPSKFGKFAVKVRGRLRKLFVPKRLFVAWQASQEKRLLGKQRPSGPAVKFGPSDILLMADAGWGLPAPEPLAAVRAAGCRIGFLSYDIIPLRSPQFCPPLAIETFQKWLANILPNLDFAVAISRKSEGDLSEYLRAYGSGFQDLRMRLGNFPLGMRLDERETTAAIRPHVREAMSASDGAKPFLIVCTVEPRKNHSLLMDAFDLIRNRSPRAKVCVVGRYGWSSEQIVERMKTHEEFGRGLHWLSDVDDTELDYCYRHAGAFVFPSFDEGFGLPIVESLCHGLTTLVSDIPTHREVGRDFCHYFSPHSAHELAKLMLGCLGAESLSPTRPIAEFQPVDWLDSTRYLIRECLRLAAVDQVDESRNSPSTDSNSAMDGKSTGRASLALEQRRPLADAA
jgi:alpha-1,2-rhamnosyltransferase